MNQREIYCPSCNASVIVTEGEATACGSCGTNVEWSPPPAAETVLPEPEPVRPGLLSRIAASPTCRKIGWQLAKVALWIAGGLVGIMVLCVVALKATEGMSSDQQGAAIGGVVMLIVYFIPAFVSRKHHNHRAITTLNLLLGWTLIGWVVALVWALTEPRKT